ncbi:MAG: hypothetical protein OHK0046_24110 [Anaerolineae bacterium]
MMSLLGSSVLAQGHPATIFERTLLRTGPGDTYPHIAELGAEVPVTIVERNDLGTWMRIVRADAPDTGNVDGWVMTGFLTFDESLRLSDIPVSDLPQADVSGIGDPDIVRLYQTPIVPTISDAMREVYARGQANGMHSNVVTKVGDSNSAARPYLPPSFEVAYQLGIYTYLYPAVEHFGDSFRTGSIAAKVGLNGFSVFDPAWTNSDECSANQYPLMCEYRVTRPTVALILFGPNDVRVLNTEQFQQQMSRIVEETLELGVIPVLSTFSTNPESANYFQAIRFNLILLDVAAQYNVPIINMWAAARTLPRYGLVQDGAHLSATGRSVSLRGQESRYGISLQNLVVLATLERIRQAIPLS